MISAENLITHELIGLKTEVQESSNSQIIGVNGQIVDETKHMFLLLTNNGYKMLSKKHSKWGFFLHDQKISVSGSLLGKRAYERLVSKN
jgi:ribonuclease P protein subunit POP4